MLIRGFLCKVAIAEQIEPRRACFVCVRNGNPKRNCWKYARRLLNRNSRPRTMKDRPRDLFISLARSNPPICMKKDTGRHCARVKGALLADSSTLSTELSSGWFSLSLAELEIRLKHGRSCSVPHYGFRGRFCPYVLPRTMTFCRERSTQRKCHCSSLLITASHPPLSPWFIRYSSLSFLPFPLADVHAC